MDFNDYATSHGLTRRRVFAHDWLEEHPDVAGQILEAYRAGWSVPSILQWVRDEVKAPISETPLRRWINANV